MGSDSICVSCSLQEVLAEPDAEPSFSGGAGVSSRPARANAETPLRRSPKEPTRRLAPAANDWDQELQAALEDARLGEHGAGTAAGAEDQEGAFDFFEQDVWCRGISNCSWG